VLSAYAHRVNLNFVWRLYANQIVNAAVKVYMLWRLAKQKWANRGNQKAGFAGNGMVAVARDAMAAWLTVISFAGIFLIVLVYTRLLTVPSVDFLDAVVFR
jgi:glycosyltransferase Alg8